MLLLSSLEVSAIAQPLRHGALFRWFYHFSDLNQFFSSQNTVLFLPWRDDNRFLCLDRDWPSHLCRPPQHRLSLCSPPPGQILGGLWVSHKILLLLWAHHLRRALWPRPCKGQVYRARRHLTVDYFHHYGIVPEYAFLSLTLLPPPTLQTGEHSLPLSLRLLPFSCRQHHCPRPAKRSPQSWISGSLFPVKPSPLSDVSPPSICFIVSPPRGFYTTIGLTPPTPTPPTRHPTSISPPPSDRTRVLEQSGTTPDRNQGHKQVELLCCCCGLNEHAR